MSSTRNPGRVVGLWYLSLVVIGPLTLLYIPNKLFVHGDAAATAANIAAYQGLFKVGMLADLLGSVILIFLVLDRKSTRLNSSHSQISYAVFCLKKKKKPNPQHEG